MAEDDDGLRARRHFRPRNFPRRGCRVRRTWMPRGLVGHLNPRLTPIRGRLGALLSSWSRSRSPTYRATSAILRVTASIVPSRVTISSGRPPVREEKFAYANASPTARVKRSPNSLLQFFHQEIAWSSMITGTIMSPRCVQIKRQRPLLSTVFALYVIAGNKRNQRRCLPDLPANPVADRADGYRVLVVIQLRDPEVAFKPFLMQEVADPGNVRSSITNKHTRRTLLLAHRFPARRRASLSTQFIIWLLPFACCKLITLALQDANAGSGLPIGQSGKVRASFDCVQRPQMRPATSKALSSSGCFMIARLSASAPRSTSATVPRKGAPVRPRPTPLY